MAEVTKLGAKRPYTFPKEYETLLREFQQMVEKFPGAKARFKLADVGSGREPAPAIDIPWVCEDRGDFGIVCEPHPGLALQ